ncbi:MAG: rhodanese-like domain-containing protein [Arenicellales bacterium]
MHRKILISSCLLLRFTYITSATAEDGSANNDQEMLVNITRTLSSVDVQHNGKTVTIQRQQDTGNRMNPDFTLTSRKCPPFCIQPLVIAPGVETVGEVEVLEYLKRKAEGDDTVLVIDSRGPKWIAKGTIPGSVNIHYKKLSLNTADEGEMANIIEKQFGADRLSKFWDFSDARTLVFFCNGMWCGQSPRNIRSLLKIGYPPAKIKWYRGGMQAWETMGLTTVKPE